MMHASKYSSYAAMDAVHPLDVVSGSQIDLIKLHLKPTPETDLKHFIYLPYVYIMMKVL